MTLNNILSALFIACVILIGVGVYKEVRAANLNAQRTDANGRSYKPHVGDTVLYTYKAGVLRMRGPNGELWPVGGTVERREIANIWRSKRDRPGEPAEIGTPDYNSGPLWITFIYNGNVQEHQPQTEWFGQVTTIVVL